MIEYLALPAWDTLATPLDAWVERLGGGDRARVAVERESPTVVWLGVAAPRLRGYAVIEEGHVAAINFELHADDPEPALALIRAAADDLRWELHADDPDDPDDDD